MAQRDQRLYIGVGGYVVAVDPSSVTELWRTRLKMSSFVTVWQSGDRIYAGAGGELFCLAPSGDVLWRNRLKGLGTGIVAFANSGEIAAGAALAQQQAAARTAAG